MFYLHTEGVFISNPLRVSMSTCALQESMLALRSALLNTDLCAKYPKIHSEKWIIFYKKKTSMLFRKWFQYWSPRTRSEYYMWKVLENYLSIQLFTHQIIMQK